MVAVKELRRRGDNKGSAVLFLTEEEHSSWSRSCLKLQQTPDLCQKSAHMRDDVVSACARALSVVCLLCNKAHQLLRQTNHEQSRAFDSDLTSTCQELLACLFITQRCSAEEVLCRVETLRGDGSRDASCVSLEASNLALG